MKFLSRTLLMLALPTFLGIAHAQSLTPQVKKSIDAQAVAFSGQHCSAKYTAKPARTVPAERFPYVVKVLDMTFAQVKQEHPEITFRSDNNGKDMYRTVIGKSGNLAFVVGYLQKGKFYTYGCELR